MADERRHDHDTVGTPEMPGDATPRTDVLAGWPNHCGCVDCRTSYDSAATVGRRAGPFRTLVARVGLLLRPASSRVEEHGFGVPMEMLHPDDPRPADWTGPPPWESGSPSEAQPGSPRHRWRRATDDQFRRDVDHAVAIFRRRGLYVEDAVTYAELRCAAVFNGTWVGYPGGGGSYAVASERMTLRLVRR